MSKQALLFRTVAHPPLVVACGLGVDSVAMLVGYWKRGIRPDLILFSDVGAERESTYDYLPILNAWLLSIGFPEVTVVSYKAKDFKHWPAYHTIEENILTNVSLPAIAYGGHSCSSKWKISAQDSFLDKWEPALAAWAEGVVVQRAVGFEASPHELKRSQRCATFAVQDLDAGRYLAIFPLQEWGWDRDRCKVEIASVGLPVPDKSSCFFCTAMKPWEVDSLTANKHMRIIILEARTAKRHLDYSRDRAASLGVKWDGKPLTAGLWRKAVKGTFANGKPNGSTPKPGSMTEYIREKKLLPGPLIAAIIHLTPTCHFTKADFDREGLVGWKDWTDRIIKQAHELAAKAV